MIAQSLESLCLNHVIVFNPNAAGPFDIATWFKRNDIARNQFVRTLTNKDRRFRMLLSQTMAGMMSQLPETSILQLVRSHLPDCITGLTIAQQLFRRLHGTQTRGVLILSR
jgi:hypothetical protein